MFPFEAILSKCLFSEPFAIAVLLWIITVSNDVAVAFFVLDKDHLSSVLVDLVILGSNA